MADLNQQGDTDGVETPPPRRQFKTKPRDPEADRITDELRQPGPSWPAWPATRWKASPVLAGKLRYRKVEVVARSQTGSKLYDICARWPLEGES